jgi:hypothetical protein
MRVAIPAIFLILGLTACSSVQQVSVDPPQNMSMSPDTGPAFNADDENRAWAKVRTLSRATCGAGEELPRRQEALAISDCINQLVESYVLPEAVFPDIVISTREQARELAMKYATGKIGPAEYKSLSAQRSRSYQAQLRARVILKQAEKSWGGDQYTPQTLGQS